MALQDQPLYQYIGNLKQRNYQPFGAGLPEGFTIENDPTWGLNAAAAAGANPGGSDYTDWLGKKELERLGITGQQYFDKMMADGANMNSDFSGVKYNPATGMITTKNFDDQFDPGNLILAAGAAGVGALSGGFGLGELLKGFGGADMPWGVNQSSGGAMDYTSNIGDIFNYQPEYSYLGDAANSFTSDFTGLAPTQNLGAGALYNGATAATPGLMEYLSKIPSSALKALGITNDDGSTNSANLTSLLGKLGASGLQAYASNQQANQLGALAERYEGYGAPSRARYEASMSPGFDPTTIPGYAGAVDTASKGVLAKLSATGGNPYGSPGALIDANKAIISGTALPAIHEYQRTNLVGGGIGSMNAAAPGLQSQAIGADSNVLSALGYGLGAATAPDNSLDALLKRMKDFNLNSGTGLA